MTVPQMRGQGQGYKQDLQMLDAGPVSAVSPLPRCPVQLDGAGRWGPLCPGTVPCTPRPMFPLSACSQTLPAFAAEWLLPCNQVK